MKTGRVTVNVRLSPFSHVSPETLRESFGALAGSERYGSVSIRVHPLGIQFACGSCKNTGTFTEKRFECPFCGSPDLDVRIDREFFVESVETEEK